MIKYINKGIRGVFYFFKKAFEIIFLLCFGFVLGFLFYLKYKIQNDKDENLEFLLFVALSIPISLLFWFIFKRLHNKWIKKHIDEIKMEILSEIESQNLEKK